MSRDDFERAVESLVIRVTERGDPRLVARAVDGRGGDGGIDIDIRERATDHVVRIFQLKHFPQGFSGDRKTVRRRQIRESFQRAMDHNPREWTLITPGNLTPDEREYVRSLGGGTPVEVTVWGAAELDGMLAEHPDLADYAERSSLRTALDRVGRSSATLATTDDLVAEARRVHAHSEAWSPYWRPAVSFEDGRPIVRYEALREDSSTREPLHYSFAFVWEGNEKLRDAFSDALDFGVTERLELPPEVVTKMRRVGPEWFSGETGAGTLVLGPGTSLHTPGRVTCVSADGRNLASRRASIERTAVGQRGGTAVITIADGMRVIMQMTKDTGGGTLRFASDSAGLSGTAVRDQFRFLEALSDSSHLRLSFEGSESDLAMSGEHFLPDAGTVSLADDAAAIEQLAGTVFAWPNNYRPSAVERSWIRVTRLILEGKTTLVPDFREFHLDVGGTSDGLDIVMSDGAPVRFTPGTWAVTMFGEELPLGPVMFFHPQMRAIAEPGAAEAIRRGESRTLHFAPADGGPLRIWMPDRSESNDPGPVAVWGIPQIAELI